MVVNLFMNRFCALVDTVGFVYGCVLVYIDFLDLDEHKKNPVFCRLSFVVLSIWFCIYEQI